MFQVAKPSTKILAQLAADEIKKYDFHQLDTLPESEVLLIPFSYIKETVLRTTVSRIGKKQGKKFKISRHDDHQLFEILHAPKVFAPTMSKDSE